MNGCKGICEGCPLKATNEVALEVNATLPEGKKRDTAKVVIEFTQTAHERLSQRIDCPGPQINSQGQLICAIEADTLAIRSANLFNWQNFGYDPADLVQAREGQLKQTPSAGQYL
jgi:hypothetical protein